MSGDAKSTDPRPSAAERKALRVQEAREAIADHEDAQNAFHENREHLRGERLVREAAEGPMVAPTPELPDDTPVDRLRLPPRVHKALLDEGIRTIGEVREKSDEDLLRLPHLGIGSVDYLRETLGLPSHDGVRPKPAKRR